MAAEQATNQLLDAALQYAAAGRPVFPCKPGGKQPLTAHGLHDATNDDGQIGWWWSPIQHPSGNVAIATGPAFFVVDIDGITGEATLGVLVDEHGPLPTTLTALTGGDGMHLVFALPDGVDLGNSAGKLGPGIDTRGTGGYIIAPPSVHPSGQRYEWLDPDAPIAPCPQWIIDKLTHEPAPAVVHLAPERQRAPSDSPGITNYARVALDAQSTNVATAAKSTWNDTLNKAAFRMGRLVAGGQADEHIVVDELTAASERRGHTGKEVADTIRSGLTRGALEPQYPDPDRARPSAPRSVSSAVKPGPERQPDPAAAAPTPPVDATAEPTPPEEEPPAPPRRDDQPSDDDPEGEINETDLGNARRLIRRHGHELRYATHLRGWLRWDGQRWAHDTDGYVARCAHATAQSIVAEIPTLIDPDRQKKRFAHALKSEAARQLESMVRIASTLRGVPVGAQQLDADPWALNVLNGTIDLRTGALRAHDPVDLITKLAPVVYDADASDDRWDAYLDSALADDELAGWLQRAVGYTLTGDTSEELLFFAHGPARSGKSTFLEAIKAALGDYSRAAEWETFLDRDHGGGARPDIARLAGARLVTSNEVDEGRKLAEGLVKTLTGGDTITARFLYRDEFEYRPQFKLWLAANHKPKVRHGDDAIWRRIRLVPFVHPPKTVDLELKAHLVHDAGARAAILAWAVRGCTRWQTEGLAAVGAVRDATESYRNEMDPLAEYFADHCRFGTGDEYWVLASELRKSYEAWANEQGIKRALSPNAFREALEDRRCTNDRKRVDHKTQRIWRGLRLLADFEEPEAIGQSDNNDDTRATRATGGTAVPVSLPHARARGEESPEPASHPSRASRAENDTDTVRPCDQCGRPVLIPRALSEITERVLCPDCEVF